MLFSICPRGRIKMKRYIGLRNIVTSKQDWKYLLFYEIDGHDDHKELQILSIFNRFETSYIAYQTLNGYHFVGLTPINAQQWGQWFTILQNTVPEYFSGQTLRLSLKEGETQRLVSYSTQYPYLERLANMYIRRFNIPKNEVPTFGEMPKYSCVFEKYWTTKI